MFNKIIRFITDKNYRFIILLNKGVFNKLDDRKLLERVYECKFNIKLNLEHPITFNEKLQWLKLYNRNPLYTTLVDKYRVRDYIANEIGEEYLIPLLGVWDSPDDIDFDALPEQFVLKCNHNSGLGMCICKDKSKLDIKKAKKELWKGLKQDYYLTLREWPYKDVPRKIIAEQYMVDDSGYELKDYKFFNFNGIPKFILVCKDRFAEAGMTEDFFTTEWEHIPVKRPEHDNSVEEIARPFELEEMLELSKKLAKDIPFVRTDFYSIHGQTSFGEMTF